MTVNGYLPAGAAPILYAYDVASPRRFAEMAFTQTLAQAGIAVRQSRVSPSVEPGEFDADYARRNVVATHVSPPLSEDVKVTLKVSDNLHADTMPYLWAQGDLTAAFARERAFLLRAGLHPDEVVQNDGLGGDAYIEPQFMAAYLAYLRTQPYFSAVKHALPVLGVDGSLFNVETHSPAAGHVFAKPGTWIIGDRLNGRGVATSKGLAGYMTTRSGRHLAFCFYVNDLPVAANRDAAQVAGDVLARMAAATYSDAP